MPVDQCPICKQFMWRSLLSGRPHKCPPSWHCWISDKYHGYIKEDGKIVYNTDPKEAACEFIARWDAEGDYVCVGGDELEVSVQSVLNPRRVFVYMVRGESVPEYHARLTEEREEDPEDNDAPEGD